MGCGDGADDFQDLWALTLLIIPLQTSASRGQIFNMPAITGQVTIHPGATSPVPVPPPHPITMHPGRSHWVSGPRRRLGSEVTEVSEPHIGCSHGEKQPFSGFECVPSSGLNKRCSGDTDAHKGWRQGGRSLQ